MPRRDGRRFSDFKFAESPPIRISKIEALTLLEDRWSCFEHRGDVPGVSERLEHKSLLGLKSLFPCSPVAVCAGRGFSDEGSEAGIALTKRWLVDSGCG